MKKSGLILCIILLFSLAITAQDIVGSWEYTNTEFIIKTNKKSYSQSITDYLNQEISDYYDNTVMQFLDDGEYYIDGTEAGHYKLEGGKFIDFKPNGDKIDTVKFDIKNDVLTLYLDPSKLGFFTSDRLKKLGITNPDDLKIKETTMLIRWKKQPTPTIMFIPPVIAIDEDVEDEDIDYSDNDGLLTIATLDDHRVIVEEKLPDDERPFVVVEQMPEFPGGESKIIDFVKENLVYPETAQELGIEGRVTLRFVINKDGSISDIRVMRGVDPVLDKEAIRLVKSMPKWIPGKQNGKEVPVEYTMPFTFKLDK